MQASNTPHPLFYNKEQAILKFGSQGNLFKLSSLSEFYRPVDTSGFAIKFVAEGYERYMINRQPFVVEKGSYLLLNGEKEANVEIDSKKNVKGICIHISTDTIADVVASIARPDTAFSDPELADFFYTEQFLENQYQSVNTLLGARLQEVSKGIEESSFSADDIHTGLFLELAEKLVTDQTTVFKQLQSIPSVRRDTKRDLCRRLLRGKDFIDSCFTLPLTIEQVAREAAMSQFHFFRLFKIVFKETPHQYILNKRLAAAKELLKAGQKVSDAALQTGFSDIFSFSKAFKKSFGINPSAFNSSK